MGNLRDQINEDLTKNVQTLIFVVEKNKILGLFYTRASTTTMRFDFSAVFETGLNSEICFIKVQKTMKLIMLFVHERSTGPNVDFLVPKGEGPGPGPLSFVVGPGIRAGTP